MDVTWECEMAVLWDGNYWDMALVYVTAPHDIPHHELEGIASDMIWEDDTYDDALGTYLFSAWRKEDV